MTNSGWIYLGAAVVILAAGLRFGWQGAMLALSAGVFLMLLQFSRALRVLQAAGRAPVGSVGSAVMLNSKLRKGMRLPDVLRLTGSLGVAVDAPAAAAEGRAVVDLFRWTDPGGAAVEVELIDGRCSRWSLQRPADADAELPAPQAVESSPDDERRPIA